MHVHFQLAAEAINIAGCGDKQAVLEGLSRQFERGYGLDSEGVLEGLLERENLGSTGFGGGIAIPHARSANVRRPIAALLKLEEPVEFGAADAMPVNLVIGLISPVDAGVAHLQALAAISRMMRDEATYDALIQTQDLDALVAMLMNATDRDAA